VSDTSTQNYGTATVTFTRVNAEGVREYHDEVVDLHVPVAATELDGGELAWEVAIQWDESGWDGEGDVTWGVVKVQVTIDDVTTDITPGR
jgi:hypothetical protein